MNFPPGLDPREYSYASVNFTFPDGTARNFASMGQWIVLAVKFYAAAAGGTLQVAPADTDPASSADIPVAASGSVCLEPGGYFRGAIGASGDGALLIIEFLYQTTPEGSAPTVVIS